jgi:hypothetical protein
MGMPVTLSGRLARAGLLIAAAAGAATVAAGCGSQGATTTSAARPASPGTASPGGIIPGGPASPSSAALCSKQAAVTRLVVSRVSALPQNHLHFTFPAGVIVSSPARARAVAEAVCGLPMMPHGPMSCPADLGLGYRLSFAAGSRSFPVVIVSAGGCGGVAGVGPARWTARSPGFWTVLAHGMGLANGTALRGTSPAGPSTTPAEPGTTPVRAHSSPLKHSTPAG